MGKEVKSRIKGPFRPFEHPEINKPKPPPRKSKGDVSVEQEKRQLRRSEARKMLDSGVRPSKGRLPKKLR